MTIPRSQTGSVVWSLTSQIKKGIKKTRSVRPWYGLWHLDANCDRKNTPVWQTVVCGHWGYKNPVSQTEVWPTDLQNSVWPLGLKEGYEQKTPYTSQFLMVDYRVPSSPLHTYFTKYLPLGSVILIFQWDLPCPLAITCPLDNKL